MEPMSRARLSPIKEEGSDLAEKCHGVKGFRGSKEVIISIDCRSRKSPQARPNKVGRQLKFAIKLVKYSFYRLVASISCLG